MTARYRIVQSEFVTSLFDLKRAKLEDLPEVAFVGRSNVGKSSLLNALCLRKSLAETSKRPGRTQSFNYFKIGYRDDQEENHQAYLVDLPGYGFAKVAKPLQQKWRKMIEGYLVERETLSAVLLLIDCRREPKEEEQWICSTGREGNLFVCLTKSDKLSKNELKTARLKLAQKLALNSEQIIPVSTAKGFNAGIELLREQILSSLF